MIDVLGSGIHGRASASTQDEDTQPLDDADSQATLRLARGSTSSNDMVLRVVPVVECMSHAQQHDGRFDSIRLGKPRMPQQAQRASKRPRVSPEDAERIQRNKQLAQERRARAQVH
jgi:hypothetical protein